jgi:hypothetical protein
MELISEVPHPTREEHAKDRRDSNLTPATYNYSDPTPEMLADPIWNAIWDEIKTWDISVPTEYRGYDVTGNHATAIYLAIKNRSVT